jgi:hypothetical protein
VTFARPVGGSPTGPFYLDRSVGRSSAFACAGVIAALNAQADQIINLLRYQSLAVSATDLGGISAIIWMAMFAALKIGFEDEPGTIGRTDTLVLLAVLALAIVPISFAAQAGLLLCGLHLFATSASATPSRRIAIVLLALTGPLIWGRILLHVFAIPILALDARLVGALLGTAVDGNTVDFANEHGKLLVGTPCSSVHNMSLSIVLWATAAALFGLRADRKYVLIGVAMAAWMFALNIARLVMIGFSPGQYEFLHVGAGAAMFGWAGLIGAGCIAAIGVIRAAARQR